MIRVVLDTNIVVSALLRSGSLPDAILSLCLRRVIRFCVSEPVLAEYEEVLRRPRLAIDPTRVLKILLQIKEAAVMVHPVATVSAARDPDDNIFLELAAEAQADFLITGNQVDYPRQWATARVVTPRQFVTLMTATIRSPGGLPNG